MPLEQWLRDFGIPPMPSIFYLGRQTVREMLWPTKDNKEKGEIQEVDEGEENSQEL